MRLIFLIFLLSCSHQNLCENQGQKVNAKEVYGFYGPTKIYKDPQTLKETKKFFNTAEKGTELAQLKKYSCLKDKGWVHKDKICIPPLPRKKRSDPKLWADKNYHWCPIPRTLDKNALMSGTFITNTDELITTVYQGKVIFELNLKDERCTKSERGRLQIAGNQAIGEHITLSFSDDYVDLKFKHTSDCANFSKDFYYLLKGKKITHKSSNNSACNLEVTGVDKKTLLNNFYNLKDSVKYNDVVKLSQLMQYPLWVKIDSKVVEVKGPHHFQKLYPRIKNDCYLNFVKNLRLTNLFCNYRGVMWGSGQISMGKKFSEIRFNHMCIKSEESLWN